MEGLKPIEETYLFKSRNMLNEKVNVCIHFQEHVIELPIIKHRYVLYCTIFVKTGSGRLQFYHGGTIWNGADNFDRNDAIFKAFQDALIRRFSKECHENYAKWWMISGRASGKSLKWDINVDWEKYKDGWCKYLWEGAINGKTDNHPNFF